jgi:hypothetical protein
MDSDVSFLCFKPPLTGARCIQFSPSHPISLRFNIILPTAPRYIQYSVFVTFLRPKLCRNSLVFWVPHSLPIPPSFGWSPKYCLVKGTNYENPLYICPQYLVTILGALAKLRKATIDSCPSVSTRMKQLSSHWTDFYEIWYLESFLKICRENSSFIKSGKNNGYFTWRRFTFIWQYLADFFLEWGMFHITVVDRTKTHILCSMTFFPENRVIYEIMSKNVVEPEGPQTTSQYGAYALHAW